MGRSQRLVCIAVAWVAPLVWLALVLSAGPSDGTVVSSPTAVLGEGRWGGSVLVLDTYGDTPLEPGDEILAIADHDMADWISGRDDLGNSAGDVVVYQVRRPGAALDRIQSIEVPLTRYPVGPAVVANLDLVVLALGLLTAGSFLLWHRGFEPLAAGTLGAGVATSAGLVAVPFGVQAVQLTGSGVTTSHVAGEALLALGLGALVVAAWNFPQPHGWLARRPRRQVLLLAVPFVGYAVWAVAYAVRQPEPARLQALTTLSLPAIPVTVIAVVLALATAYAAAETPDQRVAVRLVVLAATGVLMIALVLDVVPRLLNGEALVPWEVLALVLVPLVLACYVAAVMRYRLYETDAALRRSLVQVLLATLVGAGFLVAAGAVNLASDNSMGSMVTGATVALILLPVALLLRRTVIRVVYGDRAFPYRVVSELRRLNPSTAPEDSLHETLALLSRSLRLSYASIEASGSPEDRILISVGEPRGDATTVELEVAGQPLGRLNMEVDPLREPFGPRDRRLLEDIGTQVGALVQALAANRELQRSRERLILAREEERRRLRRDLHDGLGPSLASLQMGLEVAKDLIEQDPKGAAELVGRLTDQTQADIVEIRRLVDGLRPPVLDQLGLVTALRQRADEHNHAAERGSSPQRLTWSVSADEVGALPAAVEVAAYRIALEAVNNAARHSRGSTCVVSLRRQTDALEVEIRDDGVGLDDAPSRGVGVGSMQERAEELGGTCTVSSPPGSGTSVLARFPLTTARLSDEDRTP